MKSYVRVSRRWVSVPAVLGLAVMAAACSSSSKPSAGSTGTTTPSSSASTAAPADAQATADLQTPQVSLTGAGSTFDQPFFTKAFYEYNKLNSKVTVNYASIGSGGGISQFQATTVNFGASDVPMSSTEIAAAKGGQVLQIPVALGGEAISYNVSGLDKGLKMTGSVLGDIYMGKVTNWNDQEIANLNPGVKLPNQKITVIHRSDGSGTTYIFTDYLSTVDPTWASGPGKGKTINWPVGLGGKGNEGVAGLVAQTPGAIGYVELAYALQNNFKYCQMQNAAGQYVSPSLQTVAADASQKPNVTATDFSIVNQQGSNSYPISGYSWVLAYANQSNASAGQTLAKVLDWLTHDGQAQAQSIDYVPLPSNIQALARQTIMQITTNGQPDLTATA